MTTSRIRNLILAGAGFALGCSSDSTGVIIRPPADLHVIQLSPSAPPLCQNSVSFVATKGQGIEAALSFDTPADPCPGGEDFLRLSLDGRSLLRRPDGTVLLNGDTVTITVTWIGSDSLLFQLEPTGLQFDPAHPAVLKIEYGEVGDDFDQDGDAGDAEDQQIEQQIDIWRQENLGDPFVKLGAGKLEDQNELEVELSGFSRYAIAY